MVARTRRNADVRDVASCGDGRHERLRPIAPGHADDLRAARDRALGELEQIIARLQDDRLDASPPSLPGEIEALGLATARLQVDDQRRRVGCAGRHDRGGRRASGRLSGAPQRVARGHAEQREQQRAARAAPAAPASWSPGPRSGRPQRARRSPRRSARSGRVGSGRTRSPRSRPARARAPARRWGGRRRARRRPQPPSRRAPERDDRRDAPQPGAPLGPASSGVTDVLGMVVHVLRSRPPELYFAFYCALTSYSSALVGASHPGSRVGSHRS